MRQHTPESIREALSYIHDNEDHDNWKRMGMAVHDGLDDIGFDVWDQWSQSASNYNAKAAKAAWRSFKRGGGVTVGTLIYEAMLRGYKPNGHGTPFSPAESDRLRRESEERKRLEAEKRARDEAAAAVEADRIYKAAKQAESFPYLERKGVKAVRLLGVGSWPQRKKENCLLVPMYDKTGKLWGLQAYFQEQDAELKRDRDFLSNCRLHGCYFPIAGSDAALVLCEGLATALSVREATGLACVVCFTRGNLDSVGKILREKFPDRRLIFAADNDIKEGKPNYGLESALEAAQSVGGVVAVPHLDGAKCDFNDLHQSKGAEAVKAAIEGALSPAPKEQEEKVSDMSAVVAIKEAPEWDPRPLQRAPSEPTPFPIDSLGDVLGGAARAMSEVIQAPIAICGNSVLAAAALATQGHANLLIDGRRHPLSEFFVTIGMTGERKSAIDNYALLPHRSHQRDLCERYAVSRSEYEQKADAFKKAKEEAISTTNSKTYEAKVRALASLGQPPEVPIDPFLLCEEPTYEGLIKLLIPGQPSVGLFSDEGGRMIGGHGMNSDNILKTAAGLSGLWDGREVSRVRAGEAAVLLYGRRVSLHLMCQPEIAQQMLSNALLIEQGLLSRCLVTWPTSTAGKRFYKEVDLSGVPEIQAYSAVMLKLLRENLPLREGTRNELAPRDLPLSSEAKSIWVAFHDQVEKALVDGGELASIRGLANKAPEHAARIAGILALVDSAATGSVPVKWMESGIALVSHYLNEALRLYEAGATEPDLKEAEKLLRWCQNRDSKLVTLVQIYQLGPSSVRNAKRARELMKILEDHGQVRYAPDPAAGGKREAWRLP